MGCLLAEQSVPWWRLLLLAATVASVPGCASTVTPSEEQRARIRCVDVSEQVTAPGEMFYLGAGSQFGLLGLPQALSQKGEIESLVLNNEIWIQDIVRDAIVDAISRENAFPLESEFGCDATMSIEITHFGLQIPHGLTSNLKPVLDARGEIVDAAGILIWRDSASVGPLTDGMPARSHEDIAHDPDLLREMWSTAARHVADSLVESMGAGS